ncbi:glycoside hydrolase family 31 protein [Yeosuana marina]|uniref:glycoside hydrolase family 31 protein n=1 Tax=Yeosuana marina TaxID=1565536 RepID=UPI001420E4C4|nr:TIM-barrel domain-containing protein [Yeosuana marina]
MKHIYTKLVLVIILAFMASCKNEVKNAIPSTNLNIKIADSSVILPPSWAFGYIYGAYTNQGQSVALINNIIEHDYPIDAFWIDSWIWDWQNEGKGPDKYIDFVGDTISYPNRKEFWSFMEEKNIKSGMWVWDCILKTGNEEAYEDFKSRGFFKNEYIETSSWHNGSKTTIMDSEEKVSGTWCGNIDFENPEAVSYFKERMSHFFDEGVDFLKLDRTDAVPVVKAMFELTQEKGKETKGRGFIFSHSNGVETGEYKKYPGKWTDDTRSDWSALKHKRPFQSWIPKVGLKENIAMYTDLNKHYHEIPFLANDMGGFATNQDGFIDEELYIRWLQFATFVPLTTPFSQPENKSGNIAFNISERADSVFKTFSHLKMQLFPYIYTYAHKSRIEGVNTIRPIKDDLYTYHFGDNFLVAPIYEEGARSRVVNFPKEDTWINYWNGEEYTGGTTDTIQANINVIPLFVKKGAIIPMRSYSRSVTLGTNDFLELHVYPGESGNFQLIEDDGISNEYLKGIFAITNIDMLPLNDSSFKLTINPVKGYYKGMKEIRKWQVFVHSNKTYNDIKIGGKTQPLTQENGVMKSEIISGNINDTLEFICQ